MNKNGLNEKVNQIIKNFEQEINLKIFKLIGQQLLLNSLIKTNVNQDTVNEDGLYKIKNFSGYEEFKYETSISFMKDYFDSLVNIVDFYTEDKYEMENYNDFLFNDFGIVLSRSRSKKAAIVIQTKDVDELDLIFNGGIDLHQENSLKARFMYLLIAALQYSNYIDVILLQPDLDSVSWCEEQDEFVEALKLSLESLGLNQYKEKIEKLKIHTFKSYIVSKSTFGEYSLISERLKDINKKYNKYFSSCGIGYLVEDYQLFILEYLKEISNNQYKTNFPMFEELNFYYVQKRIEFDLIYYEDPNVINHPYNPYETILKHKEELKKNKYKINDSLWSCLEYIENPDFTKALLTSEWLVSQIGAIRGMDNTFIGIGYFKSLEILLGKIYNNKYKEQYKKLHLNKKIDETMGGYVTAFKALINHSKEFRKSKIKYKEALIKDINTYKEKIRNGYSHKDTLTLDKVEEIRQQTYTLISRIINTL